MSRTLRLIVLYFYFSFIVYKSLHQSLFYLYRPTIGCDQSRGQLGLRLTASRRLDRGRGHLVVKALTTWGRSVFISGKALHQAKWHSAHEESDGEKLQRTSCEEKVRNDDSDDGLMPPPGRSGSRLLPTKKGG